MTTYLAAIDRLTDALPHEVTWAVTASANLALRGYPVDPGDVDVLTDEAGARRILDRFDGAVSRPLTPPTSVREGNIRSHYGELSLDGISVDVMGDVQLREPDRGPGEWGPIVDPGQRESLAVDGRTVPVMPIAYERRCYAALGRRAKLDLLAVGN
jgi:hypothetical protein